MPAPTPVLAECYTGTVEDVTDDSVVVVYWVDGSPVEQMYRRSQLVPGATITVGQRVQAVVVVVPVPEPDIIADEEPGDRRTPLTGPESF